MATKVDLAALAASAAWIRCSCRFHHRAIIEAATSTTIVLISDMTLRSVAMPRQLRSALSSVCETTTSAG